MHVESRIEMVVDCCFLVVVVVVVVVVAAALVAAVSWHLCYIQYIYIYIFINL